MGKFFYFVLILSVSINLGCGRSAAHKKAGTQDKDSNIVSDNKTDFPIKKDTNTIDPSGLEVVLSGLDTSQLAIDTILHYTSHKIIIAKEKYDAAKRKLSIDDLEFNPITIYIVRVDNDSVVLKQKFEENQFVTPYSFKEKTVNYISLSLSGGGSGFRSTIFKVELDDQPSLKPIFYYSELTSYMFNNDGSQILVMQGIWEMDDDSEESHFSDHKYDISIVDLANDRSESKSISITSNKYPSADYDFSSKKLFNMIHQKEPQVFKGVSLDKFPI